MISRHATIDPSVDKKRKFNMKSIWESINFGIFLQQFIFIFSYE